MSAVYLRPVSTLLLVAVSLTGIYLGTWKYDPARLEPRAAAGDAEAQYCLGKAYFEGYVLRQNFRTAALWLGKAADQGHRRAQAGLALMYSKGWGVRQDYTEAARWYRKAAEQGLVMAQNQLAVLYVQGKGVRRDLDQSIAWFGKAAQQGSETARRNLTVTLAANSSQGFSLRANGKVYPQAKVQKVEADGLTIEFAPQRGALGIARIRFADLPADLQQLYRYDFSQRPAQESGMTRLAAVIVQPL